MTNSHDSGPMEPNEQDEDGPQVARVQRFVSAPLDTQACEPTTTAIVVRDGVQIPERVLRDSGVLGVLSALSRIGMANRDPWQSEAHHRGARSKTPPIVFPRIVPWDELVEEEQNAVYTQVDPMDVAALVAARDLAPRVDDVATEVDRRIAQTDIRFWVGVPLAAVPKNLHPSLQQAAHRGKIRKALHPTAPRRTHVYCLADIDRWSQHPRLRELQEAALARWPRLQVEAASEHDHPLALPALLRDLARRLRLLQPERLAR